MARSIRYRRRPTTTSCCRIIGGRPAPARIRWTRRSIGDSTRPRRRAGWFSTRWSAAGPAPLPLHNRSSVSINHAFEWSRRNRSRQASTTSSGSTRPSTQRGCRVQRADAVHLGHVAVDVDRGRPVLSHRRIRSATVARHPDIDNDRWAFEPAVEPARATMAQCRTGRLERGGAERLPRWRAEGRDRPHPPTEPREFTTLFTTLFGTAKAVSGDIGGLGCMKGVVSRGRELDERLKRIIDSHSRDPTSGH